MVNSRHTGFLAVVASGLLGACGGGGGGSTPNPPAGGGGGLGQATFTSSNYTAAAQEALSTTGYVENAAAVGFKAGPDAEAPQATQPDGLVLAAPVQALAAQAARLKATLTETTSCSGGGSLAITLNDANNNQRLDAGDSASFTANACAESGVVLGGRMTLSVLSLSGDLDGANYLVRLAASYDGFSVRSGSETVVGSGSLTIEAQSAGNTGSSTVQVSNLGFTATVGSQTYTRSLRNYAATAARQAGVAGNTVTTRVEGTLSTSAVGADSFTIATPLPLVRTGVALYPSSGQLVLTGALGSRVRLTAQNAQTALVELDADGNGSYELSVTRPWAQLR